MMNWIHVGFGIVYMLIGLGFILLGCKVLP